MGRWDFLYDVAPRPAVEVLLDEAAKALDEELRRWPPRVDGLVEPRLARAASGPPPHPLAWREAFRLARWDLGRAYEAIDAWQERGWKDAQLSAADRDAATFLWRYLTEWSFGLAEAVKTPLRRAQLLELLARVERRRALC